MDNEDVVMEDAAQPQVSEDVSSRLLDAQKILLECIGSSRSQSSPHTTIHDLVGMLSRSDVSPLAIYRAAACLRESELKEIVQFMVFAGPAAVLPALRLLNIMRGLPGVWELTVELLDQYQLDSLEELKPRVTTLIALLGGKKAFRLCDWSRVIHRALQNDDEESRLTMHMVLEKRWGGSVDSVYRIYDWKTEVQHATSPTIWREMQWAAHSRALSSQVSALVESVTAQGASSPTTEAWGCFEQLPDEFGTVALHYVRVGGILLRRRAVDTGQVVLRSDGSSASSDHGHLDILERDAFVVTPSLRPVIRALAGALCYGVPVVLEGGSGCGKTSIMSLLGRETLYHKPSHKSEVPGVTFIQMDSALSESDGDTFDSLVGGVVPLPEGGGFRWRPGPIGLAVERGEWLVFENLGKLSARSSPAIPIISQLAALRPGDVMSAPGRGEPLCTGTGFRCLGTRTNSDCERDDRWEPPGGWSVWERVSVPALSEYEKVDLLKRKYPFIKDCVSRVLKATGGVSDFVRSHHGPLSRDATLREAVRICTRLNMLRAERAELLTAENALLETIDVLAAWCPVEDQRRALLEILSTCWSLPTDVAGHLWFRHRPAFAWEGLTLRIGRASMLATASSDMTGLSRLTLTGYTLRLLERLLRCVQANEHVLLIGDAGSGKTAVIQELATFLRMKLVVVNLSRQSELGDLIGMFRPVELAAVVPLLARKFEEAFCITMSKKRNGRFLDALQRASRSAEDHPRAVRLMQGAVKAIPSSAKKAEAHIAEKWQAITEELTKAVPLLEPAIGAVNGQNSDRATDDISDSRERPRKKQKAGLATPNVHREPLADGPKKRARSKRKVDFRFSEGVLARAMRGGHWVLLDEINLAPADLLERLVSVVDRGQVLLPDEAGARLTKAEGFRLFAAMNPPTDVGKRPLPGVLRARFSEFHCADMLDKDDIILMSLHRLYGRRSLEDVKNHLLPGRAVAQDIASFFLKCSSLGREGRLEEVSGKPVRFSLRTLSRMLDFASGLGRYMKRSEKGIRRALFEGAVLSFATPLPAASRVFVSNVAVTILLQSESKSPRIEPLCGALTIPANVKGHVKFVEGFPLATRPEQKGMLHLRKKEVRFVISPTVRKTLQDVCRALSLGTQRLPILLQGPTASGKTSLVTYLADVTGNNVVRINNHEHTDLAEYLGGYVATASGSLVFHEGPLVQAARNGSWVLLDELNLAPPEVLESLNRLLDDNREIFLPESGEVVKAAPGFTVFATQNPPGLYGGRKELSRAFRSRFVEIQVSDLPDGDLLTILEVRCNIPQSFAKKMIAVMRELQVRRRTTSLFSGRDGFVTARDLFRWASRGPRSKEELVVYGFLLLGERSRSPAEKEIIRNVLVKVVGVDGDILDDSTLYTFDNVPTGRSPSHDCLDFSLQKLSLSREILLRAFCAEGIVPTSHMRRMVTLLIHGIANKEPVLLVGSTGGGKTSCCSAICQALGTKLLTVNCHQHTEASDILGSFRPARSVGTDGSLFEWVDGPLVQAMKQGRAVLIDEINMANDAVVERLNSVLELERTILLSEKGAVASPDSKTEVASVSEVITADSRFRILATMNPGGDYGKKELSPALRNRFTEIWVPPPSSLDAFSPIVEASLCINDSLKMQLARKALCDFLQWSLVEFPLQSYVTEQTPALTRCIEMSPRLMFSVRDVSTWCEFIAGAVMDVGLDPSMALIHGARLVFLDGLSVGSTGAADKALETQIWQQLISLIPGNLRDAAEAAKFGDTNVLHSAGSHHMFSSLKKKFGSFGIPRNDRCESRDQASQVSAYSFDAPCTLRNTARLARAMAVGMRPILLEGPPGCGKSSLVTALASAAGFSFVRINLSDSTEMSDLVGSEAPGEVPGSFAFRAGPLLVALQHGSWVLLDELNLASQSVLEGLNSVLDHRRSLHVPELGREVVACSSFRVFGAQNPAFEGGGRRGLPKSFLNRFTRVHMEAPTREDILSILSSIHPFIETDTAGNVVDALHGVKEGLKDCGHPVDVASFGLRDALRWCDLYNTVRPDHPSLQNVSMFKSSSDRYYLGLCFDVVVLQGLKEGPERAVAERAFQNAFGFELHSVLGLPALTSSNQGILRIGLSALLRTEEFSFCSLEPCSSILLPSHFRALQALAFAVNAGWPAVISSETADSTCALDGVALVHGLATLCGKSVKTAYGGSLADCDEFMGGYCQQDVVRVMQKILKLCEDIILRCIFLFVGNRRPTSTDSGINSMITAHSYEKKLRNISDSLSSKNSVAEEAISQFLRTSELLLSAVQSIAPQDAVLNCHLHSLRQTHLKLKTLLSAAQNGSFASFEWKKSDFVEAIEAGEWILLREADTCPPALLDRLNPLLERPPLATVDGKVPKLSEAIAPIVLAEAPANEDGSPVVLKPHPEFRIFFSLSSHGAGVQGLSRALLDRSLKISLAPSPSHLESVGTDPGYLSEGRSREYDCIPDTLRVYRYMSSPKRRFRMATDMPSSDGTFSARKHCEEVVRHSAKLESYGTLAATPRTYEADLALNPRHQLIEREFTALHVVETAALSEISTLSHHSTSHSVPGLFSSSPASGIPLAVTDGRVRPYLLLAAAEGFVLGSQSDHDLQVRCQALRRRAELFKCSSMKASYVEVASIAEEWYTASVSCGDQKEDCDVDGTSLPIDPLYAGDTASVFLAALRGTEQYTIASRRAKRFRVSVLALQALQSAWRRASDASNRVGGLEETVFARARLSHVIGPAATTHLSGGHSVEAIAYEVLSVIAGVSERIYARLNEKSEWVIPEERRLVQLLLSARELCDAMAAGMSTVSVELQSRVVEIVECARGISMTAGTSCYGLSDVLSVVSLEEFEALKETSFRQQLLLMPRTAKGQQLESRMLTVFPWNSRGSLSFREVDGFVKGLASLSAENVEKDVDVLKVLRSVTDSLSRSKLPPTHSASRLQYWTQAAVISALNLFREGIITLQDNGMQQPSPRKSSNGISAISKALFYAECVPYVHLDTAIALQRLLWLLDNFHEVSEGDVLPTEQLELQAVTMSSFLAECSVVSLWGISVGQQLQETKFAKRGMSSNLFMFARDSSQYPFWGLLSARQEAMSAMAWVTTGSHVLTETFEHTCQLLMASLRSVMCYTRILSMPQIDLLQSEPRAEALDVLLRQTQLELQEWEEHSDMWELCRLQTDAILNVRALVSTGSSAFSGQTPQILNDVCGETSRKGSAWISLGLLRLRTYHLRTKRMNGVDPSQLARVTADLNWNRSIRARVGISAYAILARHRLGGDSISQSVPVCRLQEEHADCIELFSKAERRYVFRPGDRPSFASLSAMVKTVDSVITDKMIRSEFIRRLASLQAHRESTSQSLEEALDLYHSCAATGDKLRVAGSLSHFRDLTTDLGLGLREVQNGLASCIRFMKLLRLPTDGVMAERVRAFCDITLFPRAAFHSAMKVSEALRNYHSAGISAPVLMACSEYLLDSEVRGVARNDIEVSRALSYIVGIWKTSSLLQEEKNKQSSSIHILRESGRKEEVPGHGFVENLEVNEEQDFLDTFNPINEDEEGALLGLNNAADRSKDGDRMAIEDQPISDSKLDCEAFWNIHAKMFPGHETLHLLPDDIRGRHSVVHSLSRHLYSISDGIGLLTDHMSKPWDMFSADEVVQRFEPALGSDLTKKTVLNSTDRMPSSDFYQDSSPDELVHGSKALRNLHKAVCRIQKEFFADTVEHPVLEEISLAIQRIADTCSVSSPLSKVVIGIENVLRKADEWRRLFATSANKMDEEVLALSRVAVRWRRLEMASWKLLLQNRMKSRERRASKWFFYLYDAVIHDASSVAQVSNERGCQNIIAVVDQFLRSSPSGEFARRLEMIHSLGNHILSVTKCDTSFTTSIGFSLRGIGRYYSLFAPIVSHELSKSTKVIEEKLEDFSRLLSWNRDPSLESSHKMSKAYEKHLEYYRLKTAAERTQRKLHKLCLEMDSMLRVPVYEHLTKEIRRIGFDTLVNDDADSDTTSDRKDPKDGMKHAGGRISISVDQLVRELSSSCERSDNEPYVRGSVDSDKIPLSRLGSFEARLLQFGQMVKHSALSECDAAVSFCRDTRSIIRLRAMQLRNSKSIGVQPKKRALVELMKGLRDVGLSPFENQLSTASKEPLFWLSSPDPSNNSAYNKLSNELFYVCAQRLRRLRDVSDSRIRSTDITGDEAQKSRSFCAHLFNMACSQRNGLKGLLTDIRYVAQAASHLQLPRRDLRISKDRRWNDKACAHLLDIVNGLQKIFVDLKVTAWSVGFALEASSKVPDVKSLDASGTLIQDQLRGTRAPLLQLSEILDAGIDSLRAVLQSEELSKVQVCSDKPARVLAPDSGHEQVLQRIRNVNSVFEGHLLQARAVSCNNVGVQVLAPTADFLRTSIAALEAEMASQPSDTLVIPEDFAQKVEGLCEILVEKTLIGAQNVLLWSKIPVDGGEMNHIVNSATDGQGEAKPVLPPPRLLRRAHNDVMSFASRSNIAQMADILKELINLQKCWTDLKISKGQTEDAVLKVLSLQNCVGAFITTYVHTMIMPCVLKMSLMHCHSLTLLKTVSSVFAGVCAEGFCRPADDRQPDEADDLVENAGTGFGDVADGDVGTAQDVSEQIEHEEQLLGLQNDLPEGEGNEQQSAYEREGGFEMTTDFDGDLEDVEQPEDEARNGEADVEENGLSAGHGDGTDIIDEKLWDQDDPLQQDGTEEDMATTAGAERSTELRAKADDVSEQEEENKIRPSREETQMPGNNDADDEEGQPEGRELSDGDSESNKNHSHQKSEVDDVNVGNSEPNWQSPACADDGKEETPQTRQSEIEPANELTLQDEKKDDDCAPLPEDGIADDSDVPTNGTGDGSVENKGGEGDEHDRHSGEQSDFEMDNISLDGSDENLSRQEGVAVEEEGDAPDASEIGEHSNRMQPEAIDENRDAAKEQDSIRSGTANEGVDPIPETRRSEAPTVVQATAPVDSGTMTTNQQTSALELNGNAASAFPAPAHTTVNACAQKDSVDSGPGADVKEGSKNAGSDRSKANTLRGHDGFGESAVSSDIQAPDPNPLRAKANEELISNWSEYLKVVQQERDTADQREYEDAKEGGVWEFQEGDRDPGGKIALGAATEEQHQALPNRGYEDADADADESVEKTGEVGNPDQNVSCKTPEIAAESQPTSEGKDHGMIPPKDESTDVMEDEEGAVEPRTHPARIAAESIVRDPEQRNSRTATVGEPYERKKTNGNMSQHEIMSDDDHVEVKEGSRVGRVTWKIEDLEDEDASRLWRRLNQVSSAGASTLCEQLRLVLEPTVVSRLAGGYRTGKRLNMRKVIEFVASDFRRDRIWLRRVRPDKRSYDVLLAIDDSESMSESDAGPMALESLALVTSALAKLEIGRVAVASFGETACMVRDFNEPLPLSDARGGKLLQHFRFSQKETDIAKLLQFIQRAMVDTESSDVEQIKLAFVISDGRLSGREEIKQRLRYLRDANVLVAFIIVDKIGDSETSIYDVRRVEYDANGKMQVLPYMKDFPIDFYAVVQDVQQLPIILADALRQWVEITSTP